MNNITDNIQKQESLANAKVNARQHCVRLSCLSKLQQFQVIQGHPFPCKWDANNGL